MPIVPIAIINPRIAIAKIALFLKGDRGCRTSLAIPPSEVMNNQQPFDADTLALSINQLTCYQASTNWRSLFFGFICTGTRSNPLSTSQTSPLLGLRKSQRL